MNQEKIAKFIKEVRKQSKLSQEKFGEKYGVTYQAVSKWETGKNMPDITILKEICKDFDQDINELLIDKKFTKKKKWLLIGISCLIIIVVGIIFGIFRQSSSFHFKTIKTTCDNFLLSGSIAYDNKKTSIYISNIEYCGRENNTKYKKLECNLYQVDKDTKMKVQSVIYDKKKITLEEFLKQVKFNVDHYSRNCKMYKKNGLMLEIEATDDKDEITFYSIPLELEENCK